MLYLVKSLLMSIMNNNYMLYFYIAENKAFLDDIANGKINPKTGTLPTTEVPKVTKILGK